jgi:hypothetical protein
MALQHLYSRSDVAEQDAEEEETIRPVLIDGQERNRGSHEKIGYYAKAS